MSETFLKPGITFSESAATPAPVPFAGSSGKEDSFKIGPGSTFRVIHRGS